MGSGASKEERDEGSAVTGKHNAKVIMPSNVAGQQLAGGPYPGNRLKRDPVPRRLVAFNKERQTIALYEDLMNAVVEQGGGCSIFGWNSRKIKEIVARFQPLFNEKGVGVTFCMVSWQVRSGKQSRTEHRYWFEFMDAGLVATTAELVPVLQQGVGYFGASDIIPTVEATAVTLGDTIPLPVEGFWRLDAPRLEGDAKRVFRATISVTRTGDVLHFALDGCRRLRIIGLPTRWNVAGPGTVSGENVYHVRHLGDTFAFTLSSPKTLMLAAPRVRDPICFFKCNAR